MLFFIEKSCSKQKPATVHQVQSLISCEVFFIIISN